MQIVRERRPARVSGAHVRFLDDLERYPSWMGLVHEATPTGPSPTDPAHAPAWVIELQAQVGPFARSKRLRMVRTVHEPHRRVRFERNEIDGRSHAAWTLQADVDGVDAGSDAAHDDAHVRRQSVDGGRAPAGPRRRGRPQGSDALLAPGGTSDLRHERGALDERTGRAATQDSRTILPKKRRPRRTVTRRDLLA